MDEYTVPTNDVNQRRVITSAIPEMSVAEVRRGLAQMRQRWEEMLVDSQARPLFVSEDLGIREISMQEFCYRFVGGHHAKRMSKTSSTSSSRRSVSESPRAVPAAP